MVSYATLLAAAELPFLREMVVVFVAGLVLTYVCHRLNLVPIVGFLLAGVVVGPHALALVQDLELVRATAEVGVILLLFTVGIEFRLEKLLRMRRYLVVGGGLQVGLSVGLVAVALVAAGVGWRAAVFTGCLVALSSTAIVLRLLADRGATDTPSGQISVGILIFQDLAVVLMVTFLPILSGAQSSGLEIAAALGRAAAIIAFVLALARWVVPPLLDRVATLRSQELFLLTVVVLCFGIAWLTSLGGVSVALGAFLAGLAVGGSRFREQAVGEILPLRTLFNAVFFVSVGMLLDLSVVLERPVVVLAAAVGVLVFKLVVTGGSVVALRFPPRIVAAVSLGLAQVGEFSLVLAEAGRDVGLSPAGLGGLGEQIFLAVAVLSMAATPFVTGLEDRARRLLDRLGAGGDADEEGPPELRDHVIVGGYGLVGRHLRRIFDTFDVPHVVVDLNPVSVIQAESEGVPILYGDLSSAGILEEAGVRRARMVVVAINDRRATRRIVERTAALNPLVEIVARSPYLVEAADLQSAGADVVVVEEMEAAAGLVRHALGGCGVPAEEVERQVARLREAGDHLTP